MNKKLKIHDGDTPGKVLEVKLEYPATSDMKCPFCQQELRKIHPTYVICDNCRITGEDKLWQALIDTKKKLDWAMSCMYYAQKIIENYKATENLYAGLDTQDTTLIIRNINETIKRIEALEQINNKESK